MDLKESLKHIQDGIKSELKKAIKLEGEKLQNFVNIFNVAEDSKVYFNRYNLIFTEEETYDELKPFLKDENLILKIQIKSFNSNLWVYEIINDPLFDQFLNDYEEEEI